MRTYAADLRDTRGNLLAVLHARTRAGVQRQALSAAQEHGKPCTLTIYTHHAATRPDGTRDSFLTTSKQYTISI